VEDGSQRIQDLAPREYPAKVVLRRRALELEDAPDPVDAYQHKTLRCVVVFVQKLHQHVQTASTDEHLECERRGLVHLPHERCCFQPDFVRVLPGRELGDDGDAAHEAQVLLEFDIVEDDLVHVSNRLAT
jgi:hypothetical protein